MQEILEKCGFKIIARKEAAAPREETAIDPLEEIKKAIRSGTLSQQKLLFLKNTFANKPELCRIIQAYLDASP